MLERGDHLCERGNTLLVDDDGNMVAWLDLGGDDRLEVSWCPSNYPALDVTVISKTDEKLAEHINTKCQGWYARKCNIEGVKLDDSGNVEETWDECNHPNGVLTDSNDPPTYHCPDCGEDYIGVADDEA